MFNLIGWIMFGALAGWIASLLTFTYGHRDTFNEVMIGIIGAILAGYIVHTIGGPVVGGLNTSSLMVSLAGAIVLLFGYKSLYR